MVGIVLQKARFVCLFSVFVGSGYLALHKVLLLKCFSFVFFALFLFCFCFVFFFLVSFPIFYFFFHLSVKSLLEVFLEVSDSLFVKGCI